MTRVMQRYALAWKVLIKTGRRHGSDKAPFPSNRVNDRTTMQSARISSLGALFKRRAADAAEHCVASKSYSPLSTAAQADHPTLAGLSCHFASTFPTEICTPSGRRTIGREAEYPIVENDGTAGDVQVMIHTRLKEFHPTKPYPINPCSITLFCRARVAPPSAASCRQ